MADDAGIPKAHRDSIPPKGEIRSSGKLLRERYSHSMNR
jgi:hypothetical protein